MEEIQSMGTSVGLHISYTEACVHLFYSEDLRIAKKGVIHTKANSYYDAHTDPLFRRLNLLKVKDIFKLNILKMYYKYQEKL